MSGHTKEKPWLYESQHALVNKVWGFEEIPVNTESYCGKRLKVREGFQTSWHYHKVKDEVLLVAEGRCSVSWSDEDTPLGARCVVLMPGMSFRVFPGVRHRIRSDMGYDAFLIEFSTHHDDSDTVRLLPGGPIES